MVILKFQSIVADQDCMKIPADFKARLEKSEFTKKHFMKDPVE